MFNTRLVNEELNPSCKWESDPSLKPFAGRERNRAEPWKVLTSVRDKYMAGIIRRRREKWKQLCPRIQDRNKPSWQGNTMSSSLSKWCPCACQGHPMKPSPASPSHWPLGSLLFLYWRERENGRMWRKPAPPNPPSSHSSPSAVHIPGFPEVWGNLRDGLK